MACCSAEVGSWRFSGVLHAHGSRIGYSYKTNQYGLAIDTIVGYNLVLPNSTVTHVTESAYPDLFWGLKGGVNNFVGRFPPLSFGSIHPLLGNRDRLHDENLPTNRIMGKYGSFSTVHRESALTLPQGGQVAYPSSTFNQFRTALADFSVYSQDPKASIMSSYISYQGEQFASQNFFYDGPTPPPGTFDNFTNIQLASGELKTRSYLDVILSSTANSTAGLR